MKIINKNLELAYGNGMTSLNYSIDEINDFKLWFHSLSRKSEIEYDDIEELLYDGLNEDDRLKVKSYIEENSYE